MAAGMTRGGVWPHPGHAPHDIGDSETNMTGCEAEPLEQMRLWDGRFLTAPDLSHHQSALIRRAEYHQRFAHGTGVLWGYRVQLRAYEDDRPSSVIVGSGMAYDCCGQTLMMPEPQTVELQVPDEQLRDPNTGRWESFLVARRRDRLTDPVPALYGEGVYQPAERVEYGRIGEGVEIVLTPADPISGEWWPRRGRVTQRDCERAWPNDCREPCRPSCPPTHGVLLARLEVGADSDQVKIDVARRPRVAQPRNLTRVIGVNWEHGGEVSLAELRDDMERQLIVEFSRPLKPAQGNAVGVNRRTFTASFLTAAGTVDLILPPDREDLAEGEVLTPRLSSDRRRAIFDIPTGLLQGKTSLAATTVYVTLRCDFLEDRNGFAVSAASGASGVTVGRPGQEVEGGRFESWFRVVETKRIFTVEIDPKMVPLSAGESTRLEATVLDHKGEAVAGEVTWESKDQVVATVDDGGVVTAVGEGEAEILATYKEWIGAAVIVVEETLVPKEPLAWGSQVSGTKERLWAVWGTTLADVYVVGWHGTVLRYDGETWTNLEADIQPGKKKLKKKKRNNLYGVWGASDRDVFVAGSKGTMLHYDGEAWVDQKVGTKASLRGLGGTSATDVYAVGGKGTILHFDGHGWAAQESGTSKTLRAVWCREPNDAFAVGADGTILHYDGTNWNEEVSGTTEQLWGVWGASSGEAMVFAVGTNGTILQKEADGTWSLAVDDTLATLSDVWLIDVNGTSGTDVFAVGIGGTILHFDGERWSQLEGGTNTWLTAAWAASDSRVFVVGNNGVILHGAR